MNNTQEFANYFATDQNLNQNEENVTTQQTQEETNSTRSFGMVDIWKIRRGAKKFKIHSRIPRL
ncbi:MAG: hypothetical protein ACXWCZ_09760 [Flavisolibacter sp.]